MRKSRIAWEGTGSHAWEVPHRDSAYISLTRTQSHTPLTAIEAGKRKESEIVNFGETHSLYILMDPPFFAHPGSGHRNAIEALSSNLIIPSMEAGDGALTLGLFCVRF